MCSLVLQTTTIVLAQTLGLDLLPQFQISATSDLLLDATASTWPYSQEVLKYLLN